MKSIVIESKFKIGTSEINSTATYEAEGLLDLQTALPAAKAGELSSRTDDNTGVAAMDAGHGIETADKVDVYWADGVRYGMDATVDGDNVTLDGGAGDVLPAAETALLVSTQVTVTAPLTGNLAVAMVAHSTKRGHLDFQDAGGSSLLPLALAAGKGWSWANDLGFTNPLAGDTVATIKASCGEATEATLSVPLLFDAVQ